jgi:hypothetical protein
MLTFLTTKYYQKISLNCNNITSFQRKALHTFQVCSFHTLRKMRWTYLIVPTRFIFIKRSMQITKYVVKNHVIPKSHSVLSPLTPKGSTCGMAAYTYNYPEKNPTALGLHNNRFITKGSGKKSYSFRHKEVHRKSCADPDCKTKVCTTPCSKVVDTKAVGNATHKATPKADSTSVVLDPKKDINGNNVAQEAYIYDQAHTTTSTSEIPHGTTFVNQPHVIAKIIKHEDKR